MDKNKKLKMYTLFMITTYNTLFMLTNSKGLNVDLTAFKPFSYDYRLCKFYTSLI